MRQFILAKLAKDQLELRVKLLKILHAQKLSHIGSCLNSIDIIATVYKHKDKGDKFVLSNGHAGYALYTVLSHYKLFTLTPDTRYDIHPLRSESAAIDVSTGSLGQGLPIAIGMAIANPKQTVYCLISDGEMSEGSIWECFNFLHNHPLHNLKVLITANGWSAYDLVNNTTLYKRLKAFELPVQKCSGHDNKKIGNILRKSKGSCVVLFCETTSEQFSFLKGLDAHYHQMSDAEYNLAIEELTTYVNA